MEATETTLTEITPQHMRCEWGGCPAVFETAEGELVIIGKKADAIVAANNLKVGPDELAIVIDPSILANLAVW